MSSLKQEKTLLLFGFALALRLVMVKWTYVMANDGVVYIGMARDLFSGDQAAFLRSNSHPLYPMLIGMARKGIGDWELAGKLVSAAAGSLLVIPFYIWGRENFGERTALYSAVFLAVSPYHVRYSADVITESTYILFFFLATIFSIDAVFKKKLRLFFWAGLFMGLAYLVRPEGVVLLAPLVVWTLFARFPIAKQKMAAVVLLVLSVSIFVFPYMLSLRSHHGRWLITAKYDVGSISGLQEAVPRPGPGATENDAGQEATENVPRRKGNSLLSAGIKKNLRTLGYLGDKFAVTYHPLMTLLLLYGIVRRKIPWRENRANWYLLLVMVIYLLILFRIHMVYDWFGRRHILPLTVLALYWAGMSFGSFADSLKRFVADRRGSRAPREGRLTALCLVIILAIILPKALKPQRLDKLPEKRVGIWLRETSTKRPVIITNMGRVSFYAGGINHHPPFGDIDNLVDYAEKNAADYIVFNEDIESRYPGFFAEAGDKGLRLVLMEGGEKEEKVLVYRVK